MKETSNIIVPVDFTESTESLVEYAVYMAGKLSATLHFVHVFNFSHVTDFYAGDVMIGVPYYQECEEELLANAKEKMLRLVEDNSQRCSGCTGEVIIGEPVEKIIDFAREKGSDLIIISTHGAKGLEKILLGSVAGRVVKRAHCPVLTINPHKNCYPIKSRDKEHTNQKYNKGGVMEMKDELKKMIEKLKMERDEINLKIHLASMDAQKEFEEAEKKWSHVKAKASDIADDGKEFSEELISKTKIVGEELKETYRRISKRLSE